MTYSLTFRAADKAAAKAKAAEQMDFVVKQQPSHARDRAAAIANASAMIDLLDDDATQDVHVTMNGSITPTFDAEAPTLTGVACHAYAGHAPRED